MSTIRVQLAHLRAARGLTQQQLAERTGLRRDTISALERGKSRAIEFETLARLSDALGVGTSDILAVATTAHVAPVLGGEDEDAIIEDRLAEAEAEIDALIADPARATQALSIDAVTSPDPAKSQGDRADLISQLREISRNAASRLEGGYSGIDTTALQEVLRQHDLGQSGEAFQAGMLIGIIAVKGGEVVAVPIEAEERQAALAGSQC